MAARTSRKPLVLVIVVLVLLGLVVAVNFAGPVIAEKVLADQLQKSQHLSSEPDVDIDGHLFVKQLITAHVDQVQIDATGVSLGADAHGARLNRLHTVLHDVHTSRSFHEVRAGTLTATGDTDYAQLSTALGHGDLAYGGSGRIKLEESLSKYGLDFGATVSAQPVIDGDQLAFSDVRIDSAGPLVSTISGALTTLFKIKVPVDEVPFGLTPTSITVAKDGVHFALTGKNVDLTQQQ